MRQRFKARQLFEARRATCVRMPRLAAATVLKEVEKSKKLTSEVNVVSLACLGSAGPNKLNFPVAG